MAPLDIFKRAGRFWGRWAGERTAAGIRAKFDEILPGLKDKLPPGGSVNDAWTQFRDGYRTGVSERGKGPLERPPII